MILRWLSRDRGHLSREELSTYVDGGPGAPSEAHVEAHLAVCGETCATELAELRTTVAILRNIAPVAPPRSFALTAEMIADLPNGKPLGSPPPMRDASRRSGIPVFAPAAAAIAAALVFAVVLVGNLSGAIEQSSSTSRDTSAAAAVSQTVARESVIEEPAAAGAVAESAAPAAAAAAPVAEAALAVEPEADLAVSGDAASTESKSVPEIESLVADDTESLPFAPGEPELAAATADELEAAPPSRAAEPEFPAPDGTPQILPSGGIGGAAGDGAADAIELFEIEQTTSELTFDSADDDDFDLPVWQILLATGLAALALAGAAFAAARRPRQY